jgi:hypothetical protein
MRIASGFSMKEKLIPLRLNELLGGMRATANQV